MMLAERVYAAWRASFHSPGTLVASSRAAQPWLDDAVAVAVVWRAQNATVTFRAIAGNATPTSTHRGRSGFA
jgi:hypothetical protein